MHPYKDAAHKNDPKWVKGLETEKKHSVYEQADLRATMRPRIQNEKVTAQAAYTKKGK